jgi:predicted TIM-barrel fold metal-dependent hydrolase
MKNKIEKTQFALERKSVSRRGWLKAAALSPPILGTLASHAAAEETRGQSNARMEAWSSIRKALHQQASRVKVFDTHEHIWHQDRRQKEQPDFFLLFSHYSCDDLLSAGIPPAVWQQTRGLQDHSIPLEQRWQSFAPYWRFTRTTGYGRCMQIAARDLFGIDDINEHTYQTLSERITAANRDPGWYNTVLKVKGGIEVALLDDLAVGPDEPLNFDPRCFRIIRRMNYLVMADPQSADLIARATGVSLGKLADLERALAQAFTNEIAKAQRVSPEGLAGIKCALAYNRTLSFDNVARPEAERAFDAIFSKADLGTQAAATHKALEDYMMRRLVEQCAEHHLPLQIHTGMQAGSHSHVAWTNPALLSDLLNDYPQVRFDIFHGGYPYLGEQAVICKNNPNCYADLCWLHIISPSMARLHLHQLIDTVPGNKILGFGGDFMHVEGAYAHCKMAREITADVLADKVEAGDLPEGHAAFLLERILHDNGHELFRKL